MTTLFILEKNPNTQKGSRKTKKKSRLFLEPKLCLQGSKFTENFSIERAFKFSKTLSQLEGTITGTLYCDLQKQSLFVFSALYPFHFWKERKGKLLWLTIKAAILHTKVWRYNYAVLAQVICAKAFLTINSKIQVEPNENQILNEIKNDFKVLSLLKAFLTINSKTLGAIPQNSQKQNKCKFFVFICKEACSVCTKSTEKKDKSPKYKLFQLWGSLKKGKTDLSMNYCNQTYKSFMVSKGFNMRNGIYRLKPVYDNNDQENGTLNLSWMRKLNDFSLDLFAIEINQNGLNILKN